jgi:hypothetical protein
MAEFQKIFGDDTAPAMTPQEADWRRREDLREQARPYYETDMGAIPRAASPNQRNNARRRAMGRVNDQVSQGMQVQTQEQRMARFQHKLAEEINKDSSFKGMDSDMRGENILRKAIDVASGMGMQSLSAELSNRYAQQVITRAKLEAEQEKLEAVTEQERYAADTAGQERVSYVDPETGNEMSQKVDGEGNPIGRPHVTKNAKYNKRSLGVDERTGEENFEIYNEGTDQGLGSGTPMYDMDRKAVIAEIENRNLAANQFDKADGEISKVQEAIDLTNAWTAGALPTRLASVGYIPLLNSGDSTKMRAFIKGLQANLGFDGLRAIKQDGSSLGQVAIIELEMLQSTVANLDQLSSPEDLKAAFEKIAMHYNNFKDATNRSLNLNTLQWDDPAYAPYRSVDPVTGQTIIRNPRTGIPALILE